MDRRHFLRLAAGGVATATGTYWSPAGAKTKTPRSNVDYLKKMRDFDGDHLEDIMLEARELPLLADIVAHLRRVQINIGHGNFYLLGFDDMLRFSRNYSRVKPFSVHEIEFMERVFYEEAVRYGFRGEKLLTRLTDNIPKREVTKIPGTGQYIAKGKSLAVCRKIQRAVGDDLILTSGVRGVVKQMHLFLNKALASDGNLSRASRSLAPPGYSYHAVGDFDVGQKGLGALNFTKTFATTKVFRRLISLGFTEIRYPPDNPFGVRFEPWHIKIIS
uniref:D-alanyl-D-alanine carboxypeptidase n=1 Tax=Candidatus Kentrum sp. MB TaxID=2138164 RepID=A0A450XEE9_9GAMM|nr:MAG: D-alanyl-D-alanine carboxypeptidase [Candidatus Kentron sp. MB]VFK33017.1 MAG: D-alanyl-D-alanine carboxypeptidase [Candidatus Kentron sp. MB]VFK75695.1 MAG: D-alanyl-D-alanine carboxypeptidase [Candidatus Kentron sp. MB]